MSARIEVGGRNLEGLGYGASSCRHRCRLCGSIEVHAHCTRTTTCHLDVKGNHLSIKITSVMESDKIFVMNEGMIVGEGTHEQLMETCEDYRDIYYSQMEGKDYASTEKGGNV